MPVNYRESNVMHIRRRAKRKTRLIQCVLLIVIVSSCFGIGLFAQHIWMLFHSEELLLTPPVPNFRAAREIYPYSIVPGGVFDGREVADTIARDSVARAHYAGIHPELLYAERVKEPILAYVSYRKNNTVQWTTYPVAISKGEVILTDGKNRIRGRCGNRIEFKRPAPLPGTVSGPIVDPPEIVFETPLPPLIPAIVVPPLPPAPEVDKHPTPPPVPPPVPPLCAGSGCIPPPVPACTGNNCPPPVPPPVCTSGWCPPPPPVPEPGTLLLVGTGLAVLGKLVRRKRR
jgi:hypothetical protein